MLNRTKNMALFAMIALANSAMAAPSIGSGGGSAFAPLRVWMQNFVDFIAGPFGTAVIIISIIIAFATWSMLPKEGIVGSVMRVVVAGIVILNVGTWLATFQT